MEQEHTSFRTEMFLLQDAYYFRNVEFKIKIYKKYFPLKYGCWKNQNLSFCQLTIFELDKL